MATYIGLNLRFLLNDIFDRDRAVLNIGLNREDLLRISGLSNALEGGTGPSQDMRALTNLDLDQEKELYALRISGEAIQNNVIGIRDVGQSLDVDINLEGKQLKAAAIKYDYLRMDNRPSDPSNLEYKKADISTSRVSSWSSSDSPVTATSPIFYGGDLQINSSDIVYAGSLRVVDSPDRIRYEAETPTHVVSLNINGTEQKFLAMKGIPLQFETFFRNADLHVSLTAPIINSQGRAISPTWRILNLDASNKEYDNQNPPQGFDNPWRYRDVQNRPRLLELYYNPLNIKELKLRSLNMSEWPNVPLENLQSLDIMFNDFYTLPDFKTNAPALKLLALQGNNLSRGGIPGTTQLNQNVEETTLENLNINGVFSDDQYLDLTAFSALKTLNFSSYYRSRSTRRMTGGTFTPDVWSEGSGGSRNTRIEFYWIHYQPYTRIPYSIEESNSLRYLLVWANNVTGVGDPNGLLDDNKFITLPNASNLTYLRSYSNNHNFIDVSGKEELYWYEHIWASLRNEDGHGGTDGIYLDGKLSGCNKLAYFIPRGVNLYRKNESTAIADFANLPALYYVDLRWTQVAGWFDHQSFLNTSSLRYLYIRHGRFNGDLFREGSGDVFGDNCPNFYYLRVLYNRNITGRLPNFTNNPNLRIIVIHGTSMNGSLPTFNNNRNFAYLYAGDNKFTGTVPAFNGAHFRYIHINHNNLSGEMPQLTCPGLIEFYVYNNNISGIVPSFSNCTSLRKIKLQNNSFNIVNKGTFALNTNLVELDLSNNNLSTTSAEAMLADFVANYEARPRGGVIINLQGNNINTTALLQNNTNQENLNVLRSVGWSISI